MERSEEEKKSLKDAILKAKSESAVRTRRVRVEEDGSVTTPHFTVSTGSPHIGGVVSAGLGGKVKRLTTISVYVDNGNVYEYEVNSEAKAREHAASIVATGYRSVSSDSPTILTWFPPSRILKVVMTLPEPSSTKYFDRIKST